MCTNSPRKAFTLIELLVVIAIVALLLGILIPSMRAIKEWASVANCLTNQRGLGNGFLLYAEENDDNFCSGYVFQDATRRSPPSWVMAPLIYETNGALTYVGTDVNRLNLQARQNGLREGAIFPYTGAMDLYHCPGDKRIVKGTSRKDGSVPLRMYQEFRSYGMPDYYMAHTDPAGGMEVETKMSKIATPGQRLLFVEDQYDLYWNIDAWSYVPRGQWLWDPLGNYHNKSCTFGFADGHGELFKWRDERTMVFMSDRALAESMGFGKGTVFNPHNPDLDWLDAHYPGKFRVKGGN